jgi:hypothetical protein
MAGRADPEAMLASGRDFLISAQRRSGAWPDFLTAAGDSTDWTTAWVARTLHRVPGSGEAVARAVRRLADRQRADGGWGYNGTVPADADSTAWCVLALLGQPEVRPSVFCRAARLLGRHQQPDGGFATYAVPVLARDDGSSTPDKGWRTTHLCVTATVVRALLASGNAEAADVPAAIGLIRRQRGEAGLWTGYWWQGCQYPTRQASLALCAARALSEADAERTATGTAALQSGAGGWSAEPGGSPVALATALAAATSLDLTASPALQAAVTERALSWLRTAQLADGSWPASPCLRVPRPGRHRPERLTRWHQDSLGFDSLVSDSRRLFTTAAVCEYLATVLAR